MLVLESVLQWFMLSHGHYCTTSCEHNLLYCTVHYRGLKEDLCISSQTRCSLRISNSIVYKSEISDQIEGG